MVSTQRSRPPEACEPGTPAENLPKEQTQVCEKMINLEIISALSIMDEIKTSITISEREFILASRDIIYSCNQYSD
ncbi:uncharacterized protein CIMG_12913 [Coccidioides immitis RS]|uniref:Uncharacterized protein n=1 Tax=Coccidioides immitis (strain RS) TaxID=246410 RepID=A0A0D8JTD7_COCIM|nr:uncharacterized protein CIMG_12913 [Coccidioides immitis RS]KJF60389.1 hypothetical protein CIMG_12913 [Coccidioides immitis RS]